MKHQTVLLAAVAVQALTYMAGGATQAQSLRDMQNKAVHQQQSELSFQEARRNMDDRLGKAMPDYVERAVSRVRAKGIRFENIESTMADYLRGDKRYGLGMGRVSYQDPQETIGVANDYVYYVKPIGYDEAIEVSGDLLWDLGSKECTFSVRFEPDKRMSPLIGEYACADFLAGKSDASFSSIFESSVRRGYGAR